MDEFLLLFRIDILTKDAQPTAEQMKVYMDQYRAWVDTIIAENKFVGGKGLSTEGKVLKENFVTDGPFVEIKESIAGFIIIKADDLADAIRLSKGCPILNGKGNSVEVRKISTEHRL
jgi:hypothetical protein